MKALTISQPYATLIAIGEKWVENRAWGTDYRGPLAIHAGKGTQYLDKVQLAKYPTSEIIAVVDLVACIRISGPRRWDRSHLLADGITVDDVLKHVHTEGPWCWVLQHVRRLPSGVWCRGMQGLWTVPQLAKREIEEQLAAMAMED
jgi:hypothetical protein